MNEEQKKFLVRAIVFVFLGGILPFVFIAWRYQIFKFDKTSLTGFGFIGVAILIWMGLYVGKSFKECFPHTMFSQCADGYSKIVVPLLALLMLVYGIRNNIDAFIQALIVICGCEAFAIPINPFPKAKYLAKLKLKESENQKQASNIASELGKMWKSMKEEESK